MDRMASISSYEAPVITLGWRLRIAMERADIKRSDMAARMGVKQSTITRWTHDVGAPPRRIYLERWAEVTNVPLSWLAGTEEESGRNSRRYSDALVAA